MSSLTSDLVRAARVASVPRGVGHVSDIVVARAENAEIWDVEGKRFIDFAAGIAVLNTGHNNPDVVAAVRAQLEKFSHLCFHVSLYPQYVELAQRLNALVPATAARKTMLVTTGAEAVENAIKIARAYTSRSAVIAFAGAFHGRTHMTMGLTGKVAPYKAGFGPMPAEIFHARYPSAFLGVSSIDALASVEDLLRADVDPARVAAIIVEPVQGEGGFYVAPPEFLHGLREICDRHGIVLIVDEIQSGVARTGRMFAHEHAGIEPDLITLAKGLGGGFPIAAVVGKAAIMDAAAPGGLGGTFAGSPVGCAAALAVLDVVERDGLMERAVWIGARITERLSALAATPEGAAIGEVRGLGAMVALELVKQKAVYPDPELTRAILAEARLRGLLLLSCGTRGNVIRLLPPLTISDACLDEGLEALCGSIIALSRANAA